MKGNRISNEQARNIAKQYILNCNPTSGEVLDKSKELDPLLIKSLETLINPSLDELKEAINEKCGYPKRRGFSWSYNEDKRLILSFDNKHSIRDIAEDHQRSLTAISARLKHHKLIDKDISFPQYKNKRQFSVYI
ncbi:hypothetical protein N8149_00215 [Gammaproteobacteria bacterium]|nr:hypothetical protein [Gammaproteobacteria bacterium]